MENLDNIALAILSSASSGGNSADQINANGRGVKIISDVTAVSGVSPQLVVTLQGKDPVSGKYFNIVQVASITSVSTVVFTLFPGLAGTNMASDVLPRTWRITYTVSGTITATIAASILST